METYRSVEEERIRKEFVTLFRKCPIPDDEILQNLGLFISSKNMARLLFLNHIYQKIVDVHGVIFDFGTRWGQNMAVFAALRGIYEPFNRHRKIVGFDTFTGFPASSISQHDNKEAPFAGADGLSCTEKYPAYLKKVMKYHEKDNPLSHIRKFEIRAGDARLTIHGYLKKYPETIIALAYFDFDLYKPTVACLEAIKPYLTKGSVLAFDELCDHDSPGETKALDEVFGIGNVAIKRFRYTSRVSYLEVE